MTSVSDQAQRARPEVGSGPAAKASSRRWRSRHCWSGQRPRGPARAILGFPRERVAPRRRTSVEGSLVVGSCSRRRRLNAVSGLCAARLALWPACSASVSGPPPLFPHPKQHTEPRQRAPSNGPARERNSSSSEVAASGTASLSSAQPESSSASGSRCPATRAPISRDGSAASQGSGSVRTTGDRAESEGLTSSANRGSSGVRSPVERGGSGCTS